MSQNVVSVQYSSLLRHSLYIVIYVLTSFMVSMPTEHFTNCFELLKKLRARLDPSNLFKAPFAN